MHTLWLFLNWPNGTAWSNVIAMPLCGVLAVLFAVFLRKPLAAWWHRHFGHRAELAAIRERLDGHADLLDPHTPGGLSVVMTELRDLKATVEAQAAGVEALASIAKPVPRRGATEMRKTTRKAEGS